MGIVENRRDRPGMKRIGRSSTVPRMGQKTEGETWTWTRGAARTVGADLFPISGLGPWFLCLAVGADPSTRYLSSYLVDAKITGRSGNAQVAQDSCTVQ